MTRKDATQITRRADDLDDLHPTHQIAGDMRAAAAQLRHNAQRAARRLAARPAPDAARFEADFARIFGER